MPRPAKLPLLLPAAVAGGTATLAALSAAQLTFFVRTTGGEAGFASLFRSQLVWWFVWAALAPAVFRLSARFPFERPRRLASAAFHLAAALGCGLLHNLLRVFSSALLGTRPGADLASELRFGVAAYLPWSVSVYLLLVVGHQAWTFQGRWRERELEASRLQQQLVQAQLQALRMQLQPHFLFNALQSVAELIHEDPPAAEEMLVTLAGLLRRTLDAPTHGEVALRDELAFVEAYLALERRRFEERLKVAWDVADDALDARVPHLLLQPIVENALRHGLARRAGGGMLRISAAVEGDRLRLAVADDGAGLDGLPPREGVGLANTRRRLQQLYGADHSLRLESREGGGAVTRLALPRRPFAAAAGAACAS